MVTRDDRDPVDADPAATTESPAGTEPGRTGPPAGTEPGRTEPPAVAKSSAAESSTSEPAAGAARTDPICRVAVWSTAIFVVVSALAAAWPDTLMPVSVPIDLVLFAAGCAVFLWAYVVAIGRSRYDTLTMGGVFLLADDAAPPDIVRVLRGTLAVQVVVAVAAAAVRPFTALAFSVLVPTLGLGVMALWAARHGRFPSRPTPSG